MAATPKRFLAKLGIDNNLNTGVNFADPVNAQDVVTKNYLTTNLTNPVFLGNQGIVLSTGTTAQRSGTPTAGTERYNTDYGLEETFQSGEWVPDAKQNGALVAAPSNVNIASPGAIIDGVTMGVNDWVLLPNQTISSQNGVYVWTASATTLVRAPCLVSWQQAYGRLIYIQSGTSAGKVYACSANRSGTIGTTAMPWALLATGGLSGIVGTVNGGTGLDVIGSALQVLRVKSDATGLEYATPVVNVTLTGDITGNGSSSSLATALSNTGVTAGTYTSVTVDVKGRITAGSNPTTLSGYGITDAINTSQIGVASGVAELDSGGKILSSRLPSSILGAVIYQGTWNATTNVPTLASGVGTKGHYYKVSVAGNTTIDGKTGWIADDVIIYNGSTWDKIDGGNSEVISVAGRIGAVILTSADITDFTTASNAIITPKIGTTIQAFSQDLANIDALSDASTGYLRKTAANTWVLDAVVPTIPDMPTVVVRKSTTTALTANTFTDIVWDTQDAENNTSVIEWVSGASVTVKETGMYLISYAAAETKTASMTLTCRVRRNSATVIPQSQSSVLDGAGVVQPVISTFAVTLTANDTLQLQVQCSVAATLTANPIFTVVRLKAIKGDTGATGPAGAAATPATPVNSVQFNNAGAFGGDANFTFDNTTDLVNITGPAVQNRLTLHSGADTLDTTQQANAALYIQMDGDASYEGMRAYFKRSTAGISGWITYQYDQSTPNIRITDEDDDSPYISFQTMGTGTYAAPLYLSVFGARGTQGSRTLGNNAGFAWHIGSATTPEALYTANTPAMELDNTFLRTPTSIVIPGHATQPTTPAANTLSLFAKNESGMMTPEWIDPAGTVEMFQPALFNKAVYAFFPSTAGTGTGSGFGGTWTSSGTVTHPTPTSTNKSAALHRTQYASTTTANLHLGPLPTVPARVWRGNAAGLGGFFFYSKFVVASIVASNVRLFTGYTSAITTPVGTDTFLGDVVGLSHITTDALTTFTIVTRNNATTTFNTLPAVPTIAAGNGYEFFMYCAPNGAAVFYELVNYNTGAILAAGNVTATLPTNGTFLHPHCCMSPATNIVANNAVIAVANIYSRSLT